MWNRKEPVVLAPFRGEGVLGSSQRLAELPEFQPTAVIHRRGLGRKVATAVGVFAVKVHGDANLADECGHSTVSVLCLIDMTPDLPSKGASLPCTAQDKPGAIVELQLAAEIKNYSLFLLTYQTQFGLTK